MARTRRGVFESSYDPAVRLKAGSTFKGSVCPRGHKCLPKVYSNNNRSCDACDTEIEAGLIGDRCTLCDYDLCPMCSYKVPGRSEGALTTAVTASAPHAVATLEPLEPVRTPEPLEPLEPVRIHPFFLTKRNNPQCDNDDTGEADVHKKAVATEALQQKPASPRAGIFYF